MVEKFRNQAAKLEHMRFQEKQRTEQTTPKAVSETPQQAHFIMDSMCQARQTIAWKEHNEAVLCWWWHVPGGLAISLTQHKRFWGWKKLRWIESLEPTENKFT